ncbi:MAG: hypothetical protein WA989_17655 [Henriciella sp.]|uniref:hypothetical protein n=1 Tax=Henriciella sp. TaxID=1968823 RepID=UPI003C717886
MILQRLATSIRKQDWFTVVIETLIVVLGVFIGLQVNNWNEARRDRDQATALLERLERDFQEMRALAAGQNRRFYENTVKLDELLTRIEDEQDPVSDAEAGQLLNDAMFFALPQTTPISFQEMLSAGRLALLGDTDLSVELREYAETARTIEGGSNLIAADYVVIVRELTPYFTIVRAPDEISLQLVSDIDSLNVAELREAPKGRALITQLYVSHANMQTLTAGQIASIDEVLEAIGASGETP